MGFLDKVKTEKQKPAPQTDTSTSLLTLEELQFILTKLRSATYKGEEFETFYNVWMKVLTEIETRQ